MTSYVFSGYKWGNQAFGSGGGQVNWSFASSAGRFFDFDAGISNPVYQNLIRAAFDNWEEVANIDFVEVNDSTTSDIRLGWDMIDGSLNVIGQAQYSYFNTGLRTKKSPRPKFASILLKTGRFLPAAKWAV